MVTPGCDLAAQASNIGETRYNKDKILQGQGVDEPLSATGFRQADAAGLFLSNVKFTHAFSSDLLRAKQTAAAILGKNRFCKDLEIKYDARLRERKYGVAEGRPLADLKAMAKDAGEQCPSFTPSGGETLDEVRERARDFFKFLCQLAVELEQKEHGKPGAPGRSSGTSGEQFVFPWTNHCSEAEPSSQGSGSCTVLDANILVGCYTASIRCHSGAGPSLDVSWKGSWDTAWRRYHLLSMSGTKDSPMSKTTRPLTVLEFLSSRRSTCSTLA
uniref:TP53 induced glycolysis regulatory phosphatase n=1 Tax=Taeniopygia guttata TaxID=59729 RepID=H0ZPV4_TAEGU